MASPQPDKNFGIRANEITEQLMTRDLTKNQRCIIDLVLRLSWDCNKKFAVIPSKKDFEIVGVHANYVSEDLAYLQNNKVLIVIQDMNIYALNKDYEQWTIPYKKKYVDDKFKKLLSINLKATQQNNELINKILSESTYNIESINIKHGVSETAIQEVSTAAEPLKESIKESIKYNYYYDDYKEPPEEKKDEPVDKLLIDEGFKKVIEVFSQNIHAPTPMEGEKLSHWVNDLEPDVVIMAIQEAVLNNARSMKYIDSILKDWHGKGHTTKAGVDAYIRDRQDKKNKASPPASKPPANNYKDNNKKQTKFHNFEQRSSKYSADELEKLVMSKKPG